MTITNLSDEQLLQPAERVRGSVVVITGTPQFMMIITRVHTTVLDIEGAASGIGKETALLFAKHGFVCRLNAKVSHR